MTSRLEASPPLIRLSPSLWWYRDTCNVYVWVAGERALLIDFGSGAVLDALPAIGVRNVEAIVHTHHHRDQCGGDDRAVEQGIPIWVPGRERALFDSTEAFWRLRRTFDSYDSSSLGFTRATSVPVARSLRDYERITWAGGALEILPTPGHTKGSISIMAVPDGQSVAFTGDLIMGHGRVPTLHDLQWQYGMPDAVGAALHSATSLARRGPDTILPSHGEPVAEGRMALRALAASLGDLARLLGETRRNRLWTTWPSSVDQPLTHILPHLWANTYSLANTYALIDDAGAALILDYGYPSWDHFYADQRFVAHTLDEFRAEAGLRTVTAVIPSHYHDDHLAGVPWLQGEHGAEAWIHASFAEIVAHPGRFDLPCLMSDPIRVDRVLQNGEVVAHAGARFETFHMPGHTMFALGLAGTLDGVRVAYTGDNLLAGTLSPLRAAAPIYRNVLHLDSIRVGVERLLAHEPELLITGHTGALEVRRQDLDDFLAWARELELVVRRLAPVPGLENEALDPYVARFDPYRAEVVAGRRFDTRVRVRNHAPEAREAQVRLHLPPGWEVAPTEASAMAGPNGGEATVTFVIDPPTWAALGRTVLTAAVTIGGVPRGELADTILQVSAA